jgi:hypothetical protein
VSRPDLATVEAMVLDDRNRVRPQAAGMVTETFRCQRRGRHMQGLVVATAHGPVMLWRPADSFTGRDIWQSEWLDQAPGVVKMTCHCGGARSITVSDLQGPGVTAAGEK